MRQRKCRNHIHKSSFIKAFLRRCHDVDQQLSGPHAAAQDQIAQQTLVALFVVERIAAFLAELQHRFQYCIKIRMHQLAFVHRHDRHEILFAVHTERQRPVLHKISEGIFHFVTIRVRRRTTRNRVDTHRMHVLFLKQTMNLAFLFRKLLLVRHALINTAAAVRAVRTDRPHSLKIFHIYHKTPFCIRGIDLLRSPCGYFSSD